MTFLEKIWTNSRISAVFHIRIIRESIFALLNSPDARRQNSDSQTHIPMAEHSAHRPFAYPWTGRHLISSRISANRAM